MPSTARVKRWNTWPLACIGTRRGLPLIPGSSCPKRERQQAQRLLDPEPFHHHPWPSRSPTTARPVRIPSSPASSSPATPGTSNGSLPIAGAPTKPSKTSRPGTPAPWSFVVTPSRARCSLEPSLPTVPNRRTASAADRAEEVLQAERRRRSEASDRRVGPTILVILLLLGAVILGQALALRDAHQQLLHERHVAPRAR